MSHVILVAFEVYSDSRPDAERDLMERLVPLVRGKDETSPIECWWIAEDDRHDGSDCDSAVFVKPGYQREAATTLRRLGLAS